MPAKGKFIYPDACGAPGKAKSQGGSSFGKKASLNKANLETPVVTSKGKPADKGVNR
jgi:hypothetical protein